jgi:hypothetical protein
MSAEARNNSACAASAGALARSNHTNPHILRE